MEAEAEARELMDPKYGYDLMEHYKDIFTLENEGNCEIIKAVTCNRNTLAATQMWLSQVLPAVYPTKNASITKWDGYRVPWEFYDTFDPAIDETGRRKDERLEVLVGEFTGTDGVLYNKEHPGSPQTRALCRSKSVRILMILVMAAAWIGWFTAMPMYCCH